MRILSLTATTGAMCCLLLPTIGNAQAPKADPKVQAIFDQVVAAYKSMPSLSEKVTFRYVPDGSDYFPTGHPVSLEVKLQKPNKISLTYVEKVSEIKMADGKPVFADGKPVRMSRTVRHILVSDGANVYRWSSEKNTYAKTRAGSAFPTLPEAPGAPDTKVPLIQPELDAFMMGLNPFNALPVPPNLWTVSPPAKVGDVDVEIVDGKISDVRAPFIGRVRMKFGQKDHTFRGVLLEGQAKDPRDANPFKSKEFLGMVAFQAEAIYDEVTPSPQLTAADFKFMPPAGATEEPAAGK